MLLDDGQIQAFDLYELDDLEILDETLKRDLDKLPLAGELGCRGAKWQRPDVLR